MRNAFRLTEVLLQRKACSICWCPQLPYHIRTTLTIPRGHLAHFLELRQPRKLLIANMFLLFHGGNTGSNPVGDANKIKHLRKSQFPSRYALRYGLVCE